MITTYEALAVWLRARASSDRGASLVEYALLITLIALVCVVAVQVLGESTSSGFKSGADGLAGAAN